MIKKDILTDEEKAYLKAVIKPFKDRVRIIQKKQISCPVIRRHFTGICLYDNHLTLYNFKENTQFKDMELDKDYTLKDLGLE